jgi:hypothetical protein
VPAVAEEVRVSQIGEALVVEWKAPSRNLDGTEENLDLREARVLRRVLSFEPTTEPGSGEAAATEPAPAETGEAEPAPTAAAPPAVPPFASEASVVASVESLVPGEELVYREPIDPLWIGKRVEYGLAYANRRKIESPLSTLVQIDPIPALASPSSLTAEASDGFVLLKWVGPEEAAGPVGYAVFRRLADEEKLPDSSLHAELLQESVYEDRSAAFGTAQCWVVVTVLAPEPTEAPEPLEPPEPLEVPEPLEAEAEASPLVPPVPPIANPVRIESEPSEEVCLSPEDVFPPAPPEELVGVPSGGGILLTWRAADASDVGSYRVYRSTSPEGNFELLAEVPRASYSDPAVEIGVAYFYFVTALDRAREPNESSRSETVSITRRE